VAEFSIFAEIRNGHQSRMGSFGDPLIGAKANYIKIRSE
jgi:hypothetical protein